MPVTFTPGRCIESITLGLRSVPMPASTIGVVLVFFSAICAGSSANTTRTSTRMRRNSSMRSGHRSYRPAAVFHISRTFLPSTQPSWRRPSSMILGAGLTVLIGGPRSARGIEFASRPIWKTFSCAFEANGALPTAAAIEAAVNSRRFIRARRGYPRSGGMRWITMRSASRLM
jgi:hypothetical protein